MSQKTPTPPKFKPATFTPLDPNSLEYTDIPAAQDTALAADRQSYSASDADYLARHPDLVAANRTNEANTLGQMNGDLPPGYAAALTRAGLGRELGAFGTGNAVAPGSVGAFGVARNLGLNFLDYQNDARRELGVINNQTPERSFGLGGQGVLTLEQGNQKLTNDARIGNFQGQNQVSIANTGNANNAAQGGFAAALNANNASNAANAQYAQVGAQLASKVDWGSVFNGASMAGSNAVVALG